MRNLVGGVMTPPYEWRVQKTITTLLSQTDKHISFCLFLTCKGLPPKQ